MKTIKTILATAMIFAGLSIGFTSCSGDGDDPTIPAAKSIEGTYNGDITCSVMGNESDFEAMKVTVEASDDATVNITVSEFGNPPMKVPSITISGVKVSGTDGEYTLASSDFEGTTEDGKAYSGKTQGSVVDKTLSIKFNLQYGAMPMPMICSFVGQEK